MSTIRTIITFAFLATASLTFGQNGNLYFSLQQLPDFTWGVFVKPDATLIPSEKTNAGTGQVTIVAPIGFDYENLENHGGGWVENARVEGPQEAPNSSYISFGFVNDTPKIELYPNEETLLFTFSADASFNGAFSLFENGADAFSTPNSMGSNPGNEIGMLDFGTGKGMQTYRYAGNYTGNNMGAMAIMTTEDDGE